MANRVIDPNIKYALERLSKLDFDYLIIGGLLCNALLKDHSRTTNDIDIICGTDIDKIETLLRKEFDVVRFDYFAINDIDYEDQFAAIININNKNILIDGRRVDYFNQIERKKYKIEDVSFFGATLEFQIADKIDSLLQVDTPECKHLIDLYSFSKLDKSSINVNELKRYYDLILQRRKIVKTNVKTIDINKEFKGSFILSSLNAGYNYSKEYIINMVNEWLKTLNL